MIKCLSLLFLGLVFLSSCTHHYYVPCDAVLLGLEEQGDIKASGGYGTNGGRGHNNQNYNIQAGYSPIKHLGVTANFFNFNNRIDESFLGRSQIGEIAIGTYISDIKTKEVLNYLEDTDLENDSSYQMTTIKNEKVTIIDVYAGYGRGNVLKQYIEGGFSELSFERYFIQSAIHVRYNDIFSFSTGVKFLRLNYKKGLIQGMIDDDEMKLIKQIRDTNPLSILEWMGRMKIGWLHFRFNGGFVLLSDWDNEGFFSFTPMVVSIGTTVDF